MDSAINDLQWLIWYKIKRTNNLKIKENEKGNMDLDFAGELN